VLIIAALLYIAVVISLMMTILLAMKVVAVREYRFTYPKAIDIFDLSRASLHYVKRERVISLFYSFVKNAQIVNRKATFLAGAQVWLRNSIVLLLVLTLLLALYTPFELFVPKTKVSVPTQQGPNVTLQPTLSPAVTLQSTHTPTVLSPTNTAQTTTITPTNTATITPVP